MNGAHCSSTRLELWENTKQWMNPATCSILRFEHINASLTLCTKKEKPWVRPRPSCGRSWQASQSRRCWENIKPTGRYWDNSRHRRPLFKNFSGWWRGKRMISPVTPLISPQPGYSSWTFILRGKRLKERRERTGIGSSGVRAGKHSSLFRYHHSYVQGLILPLLSSVTCARALESRFI